MSNKHSLLYKFSSSILLSLYLLLTRNKIEGEHFLPKSGPVILVSNHISFIDPFALGYLARRRKRQIHFLAKSELFKNKILRKYFLACGQIPVNRQSENAKDALIYARQSLENGHVVGIFPEGTMPLDLVQLPIKTGAIRLAQDTGAPIVVVGAFGAHDIWRKGHKPKLKFRAKHYMVLLPEYFVSKDASIETEKVVLAEKMLDATAKAKSKLRL
ncbi:MAG: lysophospholipid acyltransferase family protein [Acidimicrobiia bacterium]